MGDMGVVGEYNEPKEPIGEGQYSPGPLSPWAGSFTHTGTFHHPIHHNPPPTCPLRYYRTLPTARNDPVGTGE